MNQNGQRVSIARDTGLRMRIKTRMDKNMLNIHSVTGLIMISAMLIQKYWSLERISSYRKKKDANNARWMANIHKMLGILILLLMFVMAIAGFYLGKHSAFENFESFSILFAFPWIFWIFAISISIFVFRNMTWHYFFADMAFKGCLAVPCARISGTILQKFFLFSEEKGFYSGILGTSIVFGIWQIMDLFRVLKKLKRD
jgi:cytochrome b561